MRSLNITPTNGAQANGFDTNKIKAVLMNNDEPESGVNLIFTVEQGDATFLNGQKTYSSETNAFSYAEAELVSLNAGTSSIKVMVDGDESTEAFSDSVFTSASGGKLSISVLNNNITSDGKNNSRLLIQSLDNAEANTEPKVDLILTLDDPAGGAFFDNGKNVRLAQTNSSGRCFVDVFSLTPSPIKVMAYQKNDINITSSEVVNFISSENLRFYGFNICSKDTPGIWTSQSSPVTYPGHTYTCYFRPDKDTDVNFEIIGDAVFINAPDDKKFTSAMFASSVGQFEIMVNVSAHPGMFTLKANSEYGSSIINFLISALGR